jgi:tetratricopeptide (TPR) repeat protein
MMNDQLSDLLEMGVLLAGSGQTAEARKYFSSAVKADPESPYAWYYLGAVMDDAQKKQYCFSRAVSLDADIHQKVAKIHARKPAAFPGAETPVERDHAPVVPEGQMESGIISNAESAPPPPNKNQKPAKPRKKVSPFWILLSIMLLMLAILAGAAYWLLYLR